MCPHPEHMNYSIFFVYIINQSMLNIDTPGIEAG